MAIKVPDFEQLYAVLNNTKLQTTNTPLWEFLKALVRMLIQFAKAIAGVANNSEVLQNAFRLRTYLTTANESAYFPFSRQLLAGPGISFDDSITNERTISSSSTGFSWIPMATGAEPLEIMSTGAGEILLVGFQE